VAIFYPENDQIYAMQASDIHRDFVFPLDTYTIITITTSSSTAKQNKTSPPE
jgi:hypothetical protein